MRVAPAGGYRYGDGGSAHGAPAAFRGGAEQRSGSAGVGRVVTPNSTVRVPSGYGEYRRVSPSTTYRSPSNSFGGGRSFDSRGARSFETRSFDGGRAYGGGMGRASGSWGGGGGGGGRSAAPVRVSPGGGGGRRH